MNKFSRLVLIVCFPVFYFPIMSCSTNTSSFGEVGVLLPYGAGSDFEGMHFGDGSLYLDYEISVENPVLEYKETLLAHSGDTVIIDNLNYGRYTLDFTAKDASTGTVLYNSKVSAVAYPQKITPVSVKLSPMVLHVE